MDRSTSSYSSLDSIADTLGVVVHHASDEAAALECCLQASYEILVIDTGTVSIGNTSLVSRLLTYQQSAGLLITGGLEGLPFQWAREGSLLGSLRKPWELGQVQQQLQCALEFSHDRRNSGGKNLDVPAARRSVLLVSGEPVRGRLHCLLDEAHSEVTHAGTLERGLSLMEQKSFDAVVAELALPDACGLDCVYQLRAQCPQVPLIALTAVEEPSLTARAFQAGAQEVLVSSNVTTERMTETLGHAVQRQRALADISHRALHDELTSLAKRTLLHQRITNALARCRRLGNTSAVIYIDLDRFKWINDTHGHDVGDSVLVTVAERLLSAVREYDTVARLGGDEFAVLLDTLEEPSEAECVAQRVLTSLSQPIVVGGLELEVTASMGVSVFPRGGSGVEELMKNADQAMYCAKRSGRNTYSLTPLSEAAPALRRTSIRAPLMPCP